MSQLGLVTNLMFLGCGSVKGVTDRHLTKGVAVDRVWVDVRFFLGKLRLCSLRAHQSELGSGRGDCIQIATRNVTKLEQKP